MANQTKQIQQMIYEEDVKPYNEQMTDMGNCGSEIELSLTSSSNVNEPERMGNQMTTDTTLAEADSFGETNNDNPTSLKPEQENIFKENVTNNVVNNSTILEYESDAMLVETIQTEKQTTTNLNNCSPETESNSSNNTNEPEWKGNQTTTEITSAKADSFGNNANELMVTDTNQHWIPESTIDIFDRDTLDRIWATLYGQCIGDAIGLLTEFMTLEEAKHYYGKFEKLEYGHKVEDYHRRSWRIGDWTDDSDQMILLMDSLIQDKGKIVPSTFAVKLEDWINYGFTELGDNGGCGFGNLTYTIASQKEFKTSPIQVAEKVWLESGKINAPNGGLMRASIMGIHEFWDTEKVITNAVQMCKVTHFDPRCQASVAAFCSAISMMLNKEHLKDGNFDVEEIVKKSFNYGCRYLQGHEKTITEFESYIYCTDIKSLNLDDTYSIGYTFKCLGAGFWAFKQNDFRAALQEITMQAGDSDTNGAVAGALLACKLGTKCLPESWKNKLCHHQWLENKIKSYIELIAMMKRKTMV